MYADYKVNKNIPLRINYMYFIVNMLRYDNAAHSFVKSFHHPVIHNPPVPANYCRTVVLNVLHSSHLGCWLFILKKKRKMFPYSFNILFLRSFCNVTFEKGNYYVCNVIFYVQYRFSKGNYRNVNTLHLISNSPRGGN